MTQDRLSNLLEQHAFLYGIICRDATPIDIELMAQSGFHVVWLDREHSSQSMTDLLGLSRTVEHLGMVSMIRLSEITRAQAQTALDGGIRILAAPDVRTGEDAARLVRLSKYPPMGRRGVSTTGAGAGYALGADARRTLDEVDAATKVMVMIESDEGNENLDAILATPGVDMLTIGPLDWGTSLGLYGDAARTHLMPKIERTLRHAVAAGRIAAMYTPDGETALRYRNCGVRIFFVGEDVVMKRRNMEQTLSTFSVLLG
ncbi:MAG: hypothetical protein FJY97_01770 [candidate division Zixibacteria bacterium]|nr:hypothetical protein [candidate division Zixibacteria bacterium]